VDIGSIAIVGIQDQNLDPQLPTPTHSLPASKTSGHLSFQDYLCLKFWPYSEDFTVDHVQHIKTNPVPKPHWVSSTSISPCLGSFIQHPGDVTVCAADMVQAGGTGDGNVSVLPTHPPLEAFVYA